MLEGDPERMHVDTVSLFARIHFPGVHFYQFSITINHLRLLNWRACLCKAIKPTYAYHIFDALSTVQLGRYVLTGLNRPCVFHNAYASVRVHAKHLKLHRHRPIYLGQLACTIESLFWCAGEATCTLQVERGRQGISGVWS